jgi:hypothetical protein
MSKEIERNEMGIHTFSSKYVSTSYLLLSLLLSCPFISANTAFTRI